MQACCQGHGERANCVDQRLSQSIPACVLCCSQSAHSGVAEGRDQAWVAAASQRYHGPCKPAMSPDACESHKKPSWAVELRVSVNLVRQPSFSREGSLPDRCAGGLVWTCQPLVSPATPGEPVLSQRSIPPTMPAFEGFEHRSATGCKELPRVIGAAAAFYVSTPSFPICRSVSVAGAAGTSPLQTGLFQGCSDGSKGT